MHIRKFTYDKRLAKSFIDFGYDLYENDPKRIHPFRNEVHNTMQNITYNTNGNHMTNFIAVENDKLLGRLSAFVNEDLRDESANQVGTIGFFESVDDARVSKELLNTSFEWLKTVYGITKIRGPMNFDIWHGYRFMTKGFDKYPFFGEPYNKRYYNEMFIEAGFLPKYFWDSVEIDGRDNLMNVIARGEKRYNLLTSNGYKFKDLDDTNFDEQLKLLYDVINSSFRRFNSFTKIGLEEFRRNYSSLRHSVKPGFFSLIYNDEQTLAGFTGVFIDHSSAIRAMKGRSDILSKIKFAIKKNQADKVIFYSAGITPEQELKRSGLGRAGFYYGINKALEAGFDKMLIALMARNNFAHALIGEYAKYHDREYVLYEIET